MAGIIKVNQYQDFNGNTLFTSDGNGNLTTMKNNYPAFNAYASSNITVSGNNVSTLLIFDTEDFDEGSCYDTSTGKFQPQTAGKYFVYAGWKANDSSSTDSAISLYIYKNASLILQHQIGTDADYFPTIAREKIVEMNGSTDFIEIYARYRNDYNEVVGSTSSTYFGAYRIGS